jgi:hypothetical protein
MVVPWVWYFWFWHHYLPYLVVWTNTTTFLDAQLEIRGR